MSVNIELNQIYFALPPDFMQKREGKSLLVWSFLPYWMVVSQEMLKLLTCFNGKTTLEDIIIQNLDTEKSTYKQFETRVKKLVARLLEVKILSTRPEKLMVDSTDIYSMNLKELTISLGNDELDDTVLTIEELKNYIRSSYPFLKKGALLRVVSTKPVVDPSKFLAIAKMATFKGMNVIADIPIDSYTPEFISEITKMRVQVQVNLDGPYASLNDAIQGEGSFDRTIYTINNLVSKNMYVILNMDTSEHNYQEIDMLLKLAKSLSVNECRVIPLKKINKYQSFRTPDYREIINSILNEIEKDPFYLSLLGRDIFTIFEQILHQNQRKADCGAGTNQIYLEADGTIYPCIGLNMEQFKLGNAKTDTLEELWENSNVLQFIRKQFNVENFPNCARCVIRFWCRAGCRAEVIRNTHKAHNPALSCKTLQATFIDLFWKLADKEEIVKPRQPYC